MPIDLTGVAVAFVSGGSAVAIIAWAKERWRRRQPEFVEATNLKHAAQALAAVTEAREALEQDNARLREQMAQERTYYLSEIERIRTQLVSALAELDQLKTGITSNPRPQEGAQS